MSHPVPNQFPRKCPCGGFITAADWAQLPCLGHQVDDYEALELRNHVCGSTLAILTAIYRLDV